MLGQIELSVMECAVIRGVANKLPRRGNEVSHPIPGTQPPPPIRDGGPVSSTIRRPADDPSPNTEGKRGATGSVWAWLAIASPGTTCQISSRRDQHREARQGRGHAGYRDRVGWTTQVRLLAQKRISADAGTVQEKKRKHRDQ